MFYFAGQAIYLFGMSRDEHREKMPNYLLQWEAMRRAKALGCRIYNLWGAPNVFNESDDLWGVFRFKEGLGGYVFRSLGAWDFTPNPTPVQVVHPSVAAPHGYHAQSRQIQNPSKSGSIKSTKNTNKHEFLGRPIWN